MRAWDQKILDNRLFSSGSKDLWQVHPDCIQFQAKPSVQQHVSMFTIRPKNIIVVGCDKKLKLFCKMIRTESCKNLTIFTKVKWSLKHILPKTEQKAIFLILQSCHCCWKLQLIYVLKSQMSCPLLWCSPRFPPPFSKRYRRLLMYLDNAFKITNRRHVPQNVGRRCSNEGGRSVTESK